MTSRESISTLLTLFKGTRSIIGSHLTQRQTQICDFYKSSILTKQLRVHDEMWDELSQLAQESRAKESVAVRLSSASAGSKSAKDLGKRSYSTKASPPVTENKNKNVS
ncbi:hypothetical protein WICPIJ_003758 [Wickerhamomyces pijperi]|uniref:Uncharacterized protein n=1 Tax=Wickerhamomyces pijperi TaxID=599730 RepID=A0A9P8Q9B4_WICPI|nr:hypothetical protein WICPIJ_003758 [Wickerhamomyces pijperi]